MHTCQYCQQYLRTYFACFQDAIVWQTAQSGSGRLKCWKLLPSTHPFGCSKCIQSLTNPCMTITTAFAGSRSQVYSLLFSTGLAGMSIGPCAAAATFAITGNAWHIQTLQHVILVGMVLALVPILALLCLDDDKSLGSESDAHRHHQAQTNETGDTFAITGNSWHVQTLQHVILVDMLLALIPTGIAVS